MHQHRSSHRMRIQAAIALGFLCACLALLVLAQSGLSLAHAQGSARPDHGPALITPTDTLAATPTQLRATAITQATASSAPAGTSGPTVAATTTATAPATATTAPTRTSTPTSAATATSTATVTAAPAT